MIVDVLRGKTNERIKYFELDNQSTFGIMKDSKPTEIKYIIEKLEEQGYIISVGAGKPILRVSEMSYPVLKKAKRKLILRKQESSNLISKESILMKLTVNYLMH